MLSNQAGALIHGLDLSRPLSESVFQDIYTTHLLWANFIITGQNHISSEDYIRFCRRFGEIIIGVPSTSRHKKYSKSDVNNIETLKYTLPDHPEIFVISNIEQQGKPVGLSQAGLYWHSDLYYLPEPAKVTFLLGKILPTTGGDTLILNSYEVFDAMPTALKKRVKGVWMHHSWTAGWPYTFPSREPLSREEHAVTPDVEHPLVGCHPETGRLFLYPGALYDFENPGTRPIGLTDQESSTLLQDLKDYVLSERFIHRHKWCVGDILSTDDVAGMHRATTFNDTLELRTLHRITIKGIAPIAA